MKLKIDPFWLWDHHRKDLERIMNVRHVAYQEIASFGVPQGAVLGIIFLSMETTYQEQIISYRQSKYTFKRFTFY